MEPLIAILLGIAVLILLGSVGAIALRRRSGGGDLGPAPTRRVEPPRTQRSDLSDLDEADASGGGVAVAERDDELIDDESEPEPDVVEEPEPSRRPSFRDRLTKARGAFTGFLGGVLSREKVDGETWDDIQEALIRADVGVAESQRLVDVLRVRAKEDDLTEHGQVLEALKVELKDSLAVADRSLRIDEGTTNVWLFVGVNGVGKTTSIGKIGKRMAADGESVLMAAGDTFRAAAAEQLEMWAERVDADIVRGTEGSDPSAVIYDGIQAAQARGHSLVLGDTAGRLQNKTHLMDELRKVRRVADKEPGNVTEVLLVIDATVGQNGVEQARVFTEAVDVTGVILTKLDGSAKGGIVLAIQSELGIPVKLVGLGEKVDDLVDFDHEEFVDALFE